MIEAIAVLAFCYIALGLSIQPILNREILLRGRLVATVAWPVLVCFDGHPALVRSLMWARGETIIEQSEWPIGVLRQTVKCRDGSEYTRTVALPSDQCGGGK